MKDDRSDFTKEKLLPRGCGRCSRSGEGGALSAWWEVVWKTGHFLVVGVPQTMAKCVA